MQIQTKTTLSILAFCLAGFAAAQGDPPQVSLKLPKTAMAGKPCDAVLTVTFATGLHGYQNPPTNEDLIPTSVTLSGGTFKVKSVAYPKGKMETVAGDDKPVAVYEGAIKIPVTIVAPKKKGKSAVTFKVHYQECNQDSCFPPNDVTASASIEVK